MKTKEETDQWADRLYEAIFGDDREIEERRLYCSRFKPRTGYVLSRHGISSDDLLANRTEFQIRNMMRSDMRYLEIKEYLKSKGLRLRRSRRELAK